MTPAVRLGGVRVAVRGREVLAGLDLAVEPGECRAVMGLNGAGKTTMLRVLLGMTRPDVGLVEIGGASVWGPSRRLWRGVGHLVEAPFSYPELTARRNIVMSARLHGMSASAADAATSDLAEVLQFDEYLDVPVRRLSLGTRQKVGIGAAFVHAPRVVVLDEPTNGLDPLAIVGLRALIRERTARGAAVLVTSHHVDEVARVAERVEVLHRGRIIAGVDPATDDLAARFFDLVVADERRVDERGIA